MREVNAEDIRSILSCEGKKVVFNILRDGQIKADVAILLKQMY